MLLGEGLRREAHRCGVHTGTPSLHPHPRPPVAFPRSIFLLQLSLFEIFECIDPLVWSLPEPLSPQTPIVLQTQSKLADCFVCCVDRR